MMQIIQLLNGNLYNIQNFFKFFKSDVNIILYSFTPLFPVIVHGTLYLPFLANFLYLIVFPFNSNISH